MADTAMQLTQSERDYIAKIPKGSPPPFLHHVASERMSASVVLSHKDLSILNDAQVPPTHPKGLIAQVVDAWARGKHRELTLRVNTPNGRTAIVFSPR